MAEIDESALLGDDSDLHLGPIDESALLDPEHENAHDDDGKDETDLYEDAIAPSNTSFEAKHSPPSTTSANTSNNAKASVSIQSQSYNVDGKKYCCYVGNLAWWATDADLQKQIATCGIPYSVLADMKFFENRTNGQSKGYALVVFNTESAVRTLMQTLPQKQIHGMNPQVLPYSKQNQLKLEEAQAKTQNRPDKQVKKEESLLNMGTIRIGANGMGQPPQMGRGPPGPGNGPGIRNGPPPLMMQGNGPMQGGGPNMMRGPSGPGPQPLMGGPPQVRLQLNGQPVQPMMNRPPMGAPPALMGGPIGQQPVGMAPQPLMNQAAPQSMRPMMGGQPAGMGMGQPPQMMGISGPPPNAMGQQFTAQPPPIQNRPPTFGQAPPQMGMMGNQQGMGAPPLMGINTAMRPPVNGMPPVHVNPQMFPGMQGGPPTTEADFEEIMNRNRTVASSAISRAVSDASNGDLKGATETLLTAIALIKQSRVGHDERCRSLVHSLEGTLSGIENKSFMGSAGSRTKSHRDRSRSRERDRKRRRRSRTRSYSRSPSPHRSSRRRY